MVAVNGRGRAEAEEEVKSIYSGISQSCCGCARSPLPMWGSALAPALPTLLTPGTSTVLNN